MKKKILYQISCFIFLQILFSFTLKASENKTDSLLSILKNSNTSVQGLKYAQLLNEIGDSYFVDEKYQTAISYFSQSSQISLNQKANNLSYSNFLSLGKSFFWLSEYDSSLVYLNEAQSLGKNQKLSLSSRDSIILFSSYGNTYFYMGQLDKAYEKRIKALEISKNDKDPKSIADGYYALAEMDNQYEKYEEAIIKFKKALEIYLSLHRMQDALYCYDLLGTIYFQLEDYDKSLEYTELACNINSSSNKQYHAAYCDHSLGTIYMKMGDYKKAMTLLQKALATRKHSSQKEEVVQTLLVLAELYMKNDRCQLAVGKIDECLANDYVKKIAPLRRDVFEIAALIFEGCKDYQSAFLFQRKYFQLRDSLSIENAQKEISSLSSIHELELQKQQVEALKKEQNFNFWSFWITFFACIFLLGGIIIACWSLLRQKHLNQQLESRKNEIEEKNQSLFQANEKLKVLNGELENFAYIASHDLKGPLRTIRNFSKLLNKKYRDTLDKNGVEYLDLIWNGASHMSQLLEDVLTYSNLDKSPKKFKPINLQKLSEKLLFENQETIDEFDAEVTLKNLPYILGNESQIIQVILNLVSNAIKFVPKNRTPQILISSEKMEDMVCIRIKDNGIGIEEKYQDRIFTIFNRLHTVQEYKGTGIGLSICKKIIEKHEGKIWVESDGKTGSTFCFTLIPFEKENTTPQKLPKLEDVQV